MRYLDSSRFSRIERRYLLCGGRDRPANHAADCHRRYLDAGEPRALLLHPRYSVFVECMAWTIAWTSLSRSLILAMGLCNLRHPSTPRRGTVTRYPMVERTKSRETWPSRSEEMEKPLWEGTCAAFICGT
jgi:hypothetical protein